MDWNISKKRTGSQPERIQGDCWPTSLQETLLRAALLPPGQAESDWKRWCRQVDLENDLIDGGSFHLLPMVYQNLADYNPSLQDLGRLSGIYRKSWYKNQLISSACATLLKQLKKAGIESLLLKGVVLSQFYYQDMGVRPMSGADLLIPGDRLDDAVNLFKEMGWVSNLYEGAVVSDYIGIRHRLKIQNLQKIEVGIQVRVFATNFSDALTDDIWRRAVLVKFNGLQVKILTPEYQIMHVCTQGLVWNPVPPLSWVADCISIFSRSSVNWNLLVELAIQYGLQSDITDRLNYLKTAWQQNIPDSVLERLQQASSSKTKMKLIQVITSRPTPPLYRVSRMWAQYRYYCLGIGRNNFFKRLIHFPGYLRIKLGFP